MKKDTGRMIEVHVEASSRQIGGIDIPEKYQYYITADKGLKEVIENFEGVELCFNHFDSVRYNVYIDKRYDPDIVIENIVEALVIAQSKK